MTLAMLLPNLVMAAMPEIAHQLDVRLSPDTSGLTVQDRMRFPGEQREWTFWLHDDLDPKVVDGTAELTALERDGHLAHYRLRLGGHAPVTLRYSGQIRHGLERIDQGMGRARQWSLGVIEPKGVFLDANSGWYPRVPDTLQTFQMDVQLPDGWIAVSQGAGPGDSGTGPSRWTETRPQEDIYLVAGPYKLYRSDSGGIEAQVYLHEPDPELAKRYLDATHRYIAHYSDLIGPYPFAKFALVENFWETGYGMPSFTLLGPSVIRLPFIIHTSYPHEILHNWWGNSVFVDYASGNWCEGLTDYLADYWLKEQAGQGTEARRDILKSYGDYVRTGEDFPLVDFRGRHDMASQDIGYGKAAMVFNMLRRRLGDPIFDAGLKRFYAENKFRKASYADLRNAFERVSRQDLRGFFDAWTTQPGAPLLGLADVRVEKDGNGYRLTGDIQQRQSGPDFPLQVPVVIEQEQDAPVTLHVDSDGADSRFTAQLKSQPTRVAVDPGFDVFRALLPGETPITLSNLFGSDAGLILIPANAPSALRQAYHQLARSWQAGHPNWRIQDDDALERLPEDRPVWLLGWKSRYLETFAKDAPGFSIDPAGKSVKIAGEDVDTASETPVLTRQLNGRALAWMAAPDASQVPALTRKLPHYGKYSYLVFSGPDSSNRLKGQWPSGDSALVQRLDRSDRP